MPDTADSPDIADTPDTWVTSLTAPHFYSLGRAMTRHDLFYQPGMKQTVTTFSEGLYEGGGSKL